MNLHTALNSFYSSRGKPWDFAFTVMPIFPVYTRDPCCPLCLLTTSARDGNTAAEVQIHVWSCSQAHLKAEEVKLPFSGISSCVMLLPVLCLITQCQGVNYIRQCSGREQLNSPLAVASQVWQLYFYAWGWRLFTALLQRFHWCHLRYYVNKAQSSSSSVVQDCFSCSGRYSTVLVQHESLEGTGVKPIPELFCSRNRVRRNTDVCKRFPNWVS